MGEEPFDRWTNKLRLMTAYVVILFFGFEPHNLEYYAGEEDDIADDYAELVQLQQRLEDQGEELI